MTNEFNSSNLNISNNAYGRRKYSNHGVQYLIDSGGKKYLEYGTPEQVVLYRWRQRSDYKYVFGGQQLSPNIWRSIRLALGDDVASISKLSLGEIRKRNLAAENALKLAKLPTIPWQIVFGLYEFLGFENFNALMHRHNHPNGFNSYGTPNVFLWVRETTREKKTGRRTRKLVHVRFVEVKQPRQQLSRDQKKELLFLNEELKVKACCFRFKEVS